MSTVMGTTLASNVIDVDVYARGEDGRGVVSTSFQYQASNSSETIPIGEWSDEFIAPEQGQFLWIKTTYKYNDDSTLVSYSISYFSEDGGWYTPSVNADGDLSWTPSKEGLPEVETVNIRGPQGIAGSVKFIIQNTLPTEDIQNDAFYVIPTANPSAVKQYDEYFYVPAQERFEKLGDDLTVFYNKTTIDSMFEDFIATSTTVSDAVDGTEYYLTGVEHSGDVGFYKSGITYKKAAAAQKGKGFIDEDQITTNLFYSIS